MVGYPKAFFELNLQFAHKVTAVSQQALTDVLLHYTYLYLSFGLGRNFDSSDPIWQTYLVGVLQTNDLCDWTYAFYRMRQAQVPPKMPEPRFGCFYYTPWPEHKIRLHFYNNETIGVGPLDKTRQQIRCAELTALFNHVRQNIESPTTVIGGSWLYNIHAYRRLFPPAYLATGRLREDNFPFVTLWGQFLDSQRQIKQDLAAQFLIHLHQQTTLEGVKHCFPFPVLSLECPIAEFYEFYKIG